MHLDVVACRFESIDLVDVDENRASVAFDGEPLRVVVRRAVAVMARSPPVTPGTLATTVLLAVLIAATVIPRIPPEIS
ncbi:MAG TPA: hypothetical protein VF432_18115 [Thermoanaerobaculia bacterium]